MSLCNRVKLRVSLKAIWFFSVPFISLNEKREKAKS